ncbi:DUF4190 domain-containing protein [Streptomyces antimicrobicus]|uniref:DUF4190 domain-containing protein n=1 Tax=Streptomyces antimicrobicus TaxID=2883108 RepID=A0ABS8B905_9ACTN|nr:DUF4190 domain-containing protein [Streptomyces antimicrobicus]MCB5181099.1 DUF4190 domain-containing protein [Streptomyces antimicrobicus]
MSTPPPSPWHPPQPQQPYQQPWGAPPPGGPGFPPPGGPGFPPPGFPPPSPSFNGFAIASLPVGLLCLPPLGVVFAIVALVQIPKRRERGKPLAIVGLVLSVLMSVLMVFVLDGAADSFMEGFRRGADRRAAQEGGGTADGTRTLVTKLRKGDCYNVPGGNLERETRVVFTVPCAEPHDAEVTEPRHGLGRGDYPGVEEIERQAVRACWRAQDEYAPDSWAVPAEVEMFYLHPTRESWNMGDKDITCLMAERNAKRRGSLRQENLTTEQRAYLTQADAVELALSNPPDADEVSDDLTGYKHWAHEVDTAMTAESDVLRTLAAKPALRRPADALRGELDRARAAWKAASTAKDAKAFEQAAAAAAAATRLETEKAMRAALGLTTTVPEWRQEREGAPDGGGSGSGRAPSHQAV